MLAFLAILLCFVLIAMLFKTTRDKKMPTILAFLHVCFLGVSQWVGCTRQPYPSRFSVPVSTGNAIQGTLYDKHSGDVQRLWTRLPSGVSPRMPEIEFSDTTNPYRLSP